MLRLPRRSDDPSADLLRLARWLSFLAAIGLGAALGWRLFLAPPPATPEAPVSFREPLVLPTGSAATRLSTAVRIGSPAPDFQLRALEGEPVALSDLHGRVVVVNFWATWCPPCREEMPALQALHERLGERGLVVLGVNWTQVDDPGAVAAFVAELGLTFPILLDQDGAVSEQRYQIQGLPTSVVIGRDGKVRALRIGAFDPEDLEAMLDSLLAEET